MKALAVSLYSEGTVDDSVGCSMLGMAVDLIYLTPQVDLYPPSVLVVRCHFRMTAFKNRIPLWLEFVCEISSL